MWAFAFAVAAALGWSTMSHDQRLEALNSVADQCGVPRSTFHLHPGDEVEIRFMPNEQYERADCALDKLKELQVTNMGFIGNEAVEENSH